jgi:putative membrane protein
MKTTVSSLSRLGFAAVVAGAFCVANVASAQVKQADAPDDAPPVQKTTMAPVGAKPSKAELAKRQAEEEAAGTSTTSTKPSQQQQARGSTAALSDMDRQFIMNAARDGMKEVHMGQMAAQQGQSDEVKKLGSRIAADHTKANNQLMEIAAKKGVKLDTRHKMAKMSKRDMENFDQAWLAMMVNDHQKDIAAFQRQGQQGTDPELKKFAKSTLPVLQRHLKMVQDAQQKMGSTATTSTSRSGR